MESEIVCVDDVALVTPAEEFAAAAATYIWIRSCPLCNRVLSKSSPDVSLHCICGWEWQS
jgi:hypothetical protein